MEEATGEEKLAADPSMGDSGVGVGDEAQPNSGCPSFAKTAPAMSANGCCLLSFAGVNRCDEEAGCEWLSLS
ncbi:hypothetical protein ABZX92_32385 [Lentzea sp. NPDC006480]|uniref:hypothetical protein n=1 Tax=Lentzea sp. NPDC006480 TaxID=3157176 RepID=UPI0033A0DCA8